MAQRSKRITFNVDKEEYNQDSMNLYKKYKIDMSIKELSEVTIYNYEKTYSHGLAIFIYSKIISRCWRLMKMI